MAGIECPLTIMAFPDSKKSSNKFIGYRSVNFCMLRIFGTKSFAGQDFGLSSISGAEISISK